MNINKVRQILCMRHQKFESLSMHMQVRKEKPLNFFKPKIDNLTPKRKKETKTNEVTLSYMIPFGCLCLATF